MLTAIALWLSIALIIFPKPALTASLRGLDLWWEVVFPSLLPFFVTAELLIGFGVVHGLGALCERFMRPVFNVPGSGGFVWIMGMASGYPAGAKWTAELRKKGEVTKVEAERMVAFTNASSPLFIFGAVAVGFFHDAKLGILIAVAHYGGNTLVGVAMRFYKKKREYHRYKHTSATLKQAFHTMHQSRINDGRSLGKLMGDAVTRSVDTLLMVGGFIMLFSVLTELLIQSGVIQSLSYFLTWIQIPESLHHSIMAGMLEMTTGIGGIASAEESLLLKLMVVSFLLGFHGFSIQAQIASILAETDISFKPYAIARIIHGLTAASIIFLLYRPFQNWNSATQPIWNPEREITPSVLEFFQEHGPPVTLIMIAITILLKFTRKTMGESQ